LKVKSVDGKEAYVKSLALNEQYYTTFMFSMLSCIQYTVLRL